MHTILKSLLLAGMVSLSSAATKPNVIIIFIDDMGYGDVGAFNPSALQKTPHLDRMAAEGMKLTSFYAAPVCSVSRAQLLTGCYGARVSVPGVYNPAGPEGLHPEENTIADHLKKLGYSTMCIGKWHLGDQPEFLPTKQGFDEYFGIPYSNDMWRKSTELGKKVHPLIRNDKVVELLTDDKQHLLVEQYTDEAIRFITNNKDKPFFLYLPHTAIHTPIYPGKKFEGTSTNNRIGDLIQEVDASTGKILETLANLGIDKNTLVIFTSDNGPWLIQGKDSGSSGPLRGAKGSSWEGSVRVPTIAWWPGKIPAGSSVDDVAGVFVGDEGEFVEVGEDRGFELFGFVGMAGDGAGHGGNVDAGLFAVVEVEAMDGEDAEDGYVFFVELGEEGGVFEIVRAEEVGGDFAGVGDIGIRGFEAGCGIDVAEGVFGGVECLVVRFASDVADVDGGKE